MRRYMSFSEHLKVVFGKKIYRVPIDAGLGCPNRKGDDITRGGCIFCGSRGAGAGWLESKQTITEQIERGKALMTKRYGAEGFLAYFQAYTNTLGSVDLLRSYYDEALAVHQIVGLMVGTRPDCLPIEILDLLESYSRKTYFWLELGIQSIDQYQLDWMNRGHNVDCTIQAVAEAKKRGMRVCGHLIFGLPGETSNDIRRTAEFVNKYGLDGVKIHLLHVVKGTALEKQYNDGTLSLISQDSYIARVVDFLEHLSPEVVIHRLTGDAGRNLIAPAWSSNKTAVLAAIEAELERRGSRQGSCYIPSV